MPTSSVFGDIFSSGDLITDIEAMLKKWFGTYLREVCAQHGITEIPKIPTNYKRRANFEGVSGEDLPMMVIVAPGLIGPPVKDGQKKYRGIWRVGIGLGTAATDEETADDLTKVYGAAIRSMMLQKKGEFNASNIQWLDEQYTEIPLPGDVPRLFRAVAGWYGVDIENLTTVKHGPDAPDSEPYIYHTAQTVEVTLNKEPLDG